MLARTDRQLAVRVIRAALAVLLASCAATNQITPPTASSDMVAASPSVPGDIGFGRFLDVRDFSVEFIAFSPDAEAMATQLTDALPGAWDIATDRRSRLRVLDSGADLRVVVMNASGVSSAGGRLIYLRLLGPTLNAGEIALTLHEIGHALGCCFGQDSGPDGHWSDCIRGSEIMCHPGPGSVTRFSERELRALRLR